MFRHVERGRPGQDSASMATIFRRVHGLVNTADSNDRDSVEEANKELIKVPNEDEMCDALVTAAEVIEKSGLHNLRKREWVI